MLSMGTRYGKAGIEGCNEAEGWKGGGDNCGRKEGGKRKETKAVKTRGIEKRNRDYRRRVQLGKRNGKKMKRCVIKGKEDDTMRFWVMLSST